MSLIQNIECVSTILKIICIWHGKAYKYYITCPQAVARVIV